MSRAGPALGRTPGPAARVTRGRRVRQRPPGAAGMDITSLRTSFSTTFAWPGTSTSSVTTLSTTTVSIAAAGAAVGAGAGAARWAEAASGARTRASSKPKLSVRTQGSSSEPPQAITVVAVNAAITTTSKWTLIALNISPSCAWHHSLASIDERRPQNVPVFYACVGNGEYDSQHVLRLPKLRTCPSLVGAIWGRERPAG